MLSSCGEQALKSFRLSCVNFQGETNEGDVRGRGPGNGPVGELLLIQMEIQMQKNTKHSTAHGSSSHTAGTYVYTFQTASHLPFTDQRKPLPMSWTHHEASAHLESAAHLPTPMP